MNFEEPLCTHDEHLIAKIYKILLKFNFEDEYIKRLYEQNILVILHFISGDIYMSTRFEI